MKPQNIWALGQLNGVNDFSKDGIDIKACSIDTARIVNFNKDSSYESMVAPFNIGKSTVSDVWKMCECVKQN